MLDKTSDISRLNKTAGYDSKTDVEEGISKFRLV